MTQTLAGRLAAGALLGLLVASAGPLAAQPDAKKKVLTPAEYDIWRSAAGVSLSPDGAYLAYLVGAEGADGEAVVRNVATGAEHRFPRGSAAGVAALGNAPRFTPSGKEVLLPLTPTKAQIEKAKAEKLKADDAPKPALLIVDLATGKEVDRIAGVGAFQTGGTGAGFLIYRKPTAPEPGKDGDTEKEKQPAAPQPPAKGGGKGKGGGGAQPKGGGGGGPGGAAKTTGSDLYIRDLASGATRTITDVAEFTLSRDEKTLAYLVSSKTEEKNGLYALDPNFGTGGAPLKAGPGKYSNLSWDEKQARLAFLYDDSQVLPPNVAPPPRLKGAPAGAPVAQAPPPPPRYRVFVWDRHAKIETPLAARIPLRAVGGFGAITAAVIAADPPAPVSLAEVLGPDTPGFRTGWTLAGSTPTFSQDGTKLFVSVAPPRPPQPTTPPPADEIQLDIWHWKDANIQPMQKLRATADRTRTYSAALLLDTKQLKHLADEDTSTTQPAVGDWAVRTDDRKYRHMTGYAAPVPGDQALVNIRTGEAKPLATASTATFSPSPTGSYLLSFDGKDWNTVSVPDGKRANLTAKLKVKFFEEDFDSPSAPPPYGGVQWTPDGKFVLVNDRFDIWKLAADGSSAENLTKIGRTKGIRFSLLKPRSPDDRNPIERTTDVSKPHLLAAEHLATRDGGFYRLEPGAEPKLLLMGPRAYSPPTKARDADVYLLTTQTFAQYPDYHVTAPDFASLKRVTDINPQVKEYLWGTSELVKYTSTDGTPLQGILVKPENFDPAKKYPMVVYIYERLSEGLHTFRSPNVTRGQVINPTFYASNGYLVLMPDIAYTIGAPGQSAIKCVLPAIQAVVNTGCVDEGAIGINGQSWGGYQIAYMVTQTNRFKAAVAGAPVANMVSAYDGIRWGTGLPRQFQYEKQQSRIGSTLWESPLKYIENSPVFMADRVRTPLLMIHNDQDDAVPWYQGIEYYLALRRLGREVYLLNYNGEPHNLAKKPAARDFAMRMFQFFEHHLKAKATPEWMEKGVPFIDREKEKEQWKKAAGGK